MNPILVVAEHRKQVLADVSLQALSKGRELASQTGASLLAVVIGKNATEYAKELAKWADTALAIENERLEQSLAESYQKVLSAIVRERKPEIILMGHSSFGMDLAPSLAVELGAPLATDCVDISIEDDTVQVKRSIYNGKVQAVYSFAPDSTAVVTARVGQFVIEEGKRQGHIEEMSFPLDEFGYKRFEGYTKQEAGGVDITKAEVLVSVGRGIKEQKNIEMAEKLAEVLGGVVSCSRPVVDYGWLSPEHQVGLSGKTVSPKLYLALGISGAFQHVVGMKSSRMIVAINQDARAPIFDVADYGVAGDIFKILPELTRKIAELKG